MEKIIITSNKDNSINIINKRKIIEKNLTQIKAKINNYKINNNESSTKKPELQFYTKINKPINKPKKYNRQNSKEIKENNIKKPKFNEKEKIITDSNTLNKTEIKSNNNKFEKGIRNIKVNKINFDKNKPQNKTNCILITNPNTKNINNNYQQINTIYLAKHTDTNIFNNNMIDISYNNTENNHSLYNKYNDINYKYNNTTAIIKKKPAKQISKKQIRFKDLKTFFAHIEIFFSLYLKRIFQFFVQKMKLIYEAQINNEQIYTNEDLQYNKFRPIVNVNNDHCSLYCSININQDKLINSFLNNQNFPPFSENTYTPITKKKQSRIPNYLLKSNDNNIIKRNKQTSINSLNNFKTGNLSKDQNQFFHFAQKALSKNNINKNIKTSPIKEMNINLGQLNLSRPKNIDNYQLNKTNLNKSINKIPFNNNNYTSNLLNKIKNSKSDLCQIASESNKLKKIKSAKNDIYKKPKENNKKPIKEIKIQNKLSPKNYQNTNINLCNSFCKINNNKASKKNNNRNQNNEQNLIKKIYIKRGNQISNNFNYSNISHYNTTFINYKADNEKNINDVLLIKEIRTLDNRIFINIKCMPIQTQNNMKNERKIYKRENGKIVRLYSISIINNKIRLNKELYENLKMYNINNYKGIVNFCFFDNDKNIYLKNVINLIKILKNIILNKILKRISFKYKKRIILKSLLNKKYKRNIKQFFFRFIKNTGIKLKNSQNPIYHKINYNDDFNTNNRFQTPKSWNKTKKLFNSRPYNLSHKNSNNQINFRKRIIDNHEHKESFCNNTYKGQKHEINNIKINKISHKPTKTDINNFKNKIFI